MVTAANRSRFSCEPDRKAIIGTRQTDSAIRALFAVTRDGVGNLPPMPGIFPDFPAPSFCTAEVAAS
jgi:hypothetical protein